MGELLVGVSYVSKNQISPTYQVECPPPPQVLRLSAMANLRMIKKLEEEAIALTNQHDSIRNDFGDPRLSNTAVARVTHALEHIVVLNWLRQAIILERELELGSIAVTLSGKRWDGTDIADVWLREDLGSQNVFVWEILHQVELFGGKWQYE